MFILAIYRESKVENNTKCLSFIEKEKGITLEAYEGSPLRLPYAQGGQMCSRLPHRVDGAQLSKEIKAT